MNSLVLVRRLSNLAHRSQLSKVALSDVRLLRSIGGKQYLIQVDAKFANNNLIRQSARYLHQTHFTDQSHKVDLQQQAQEQQCDKNLSITPHVDERLSYAYGRSLRELKYYTLGPMMDMMSKREPHSTAVVVYDEGISKNFEQLHRDINRLVNGMVHTLGLKRGDKVGVFSYNNYQFVLIQYACHKLGLVLTPINPSYKSHEFSYVMGKTDVDVLFTPARNCNQASLNDHWSVVCDKAMADKKNEGLLNKLKNIVILDGDYDEKEMPFKDVKVNRWRSVFANDAELDTEVQKQVDQVRSDDIFGIYYTSGTTGFPKGAAITQFNAINNAAFSCERVFAQRGPNFQSIRPNVCLPLPLFHEFAGILGVLLPFIDGGSFVLPGIRYNIKSVVDSIIRFKCNAVFLTPTILIDMLAHVERNKITKFPLRSILIAGSTVMPELVYKTYKILPELEELRIGYGSSENGVIASIQTSQEPAENRPYTVGPPLDFTEIRIADTNTGETTLIGQSGEVQTRGYNTMLCYHQDQDKTSEVITKNRWYKTGDLGIIDRHGSLQIVGRIKDLIIKGGENIYPAEVETILHTHDAIEDAHVFGVPDKRFGEEVCVWVKLKKPRSEVNEDEIKKEIIEYCKEKLTYFKVPKYVIFTEEFPVTPARKIKKFEMRAQTTKMLNLN